MGELSVVLGVLTEKMRLGEVSPCFLWFVSVGLDLSESGLTIKLLLIQRKGELERPFIGRLVL